MAAVFPANQVIVVGGGLAGMSAANTVVENGGRSLLLDKSSFCGGNSTKATSGINGAGTKTQKGKSIPDNAETSGLKNTNQEIFIADTLKGGAKKPELAKVLCANSAADVDWLVDKFDLDLSLVARLGGHSQPRTHRGKERFPGMTITYALIQMLEKVAEKTNRARIITKAEVFKLVQSGRSVVGCEYRKAGKVTKEFGPMVLASGGFGADFGSDSLLATYRPDLLHLPTTNGEHCTGDAIKMGEAIGAATIDLEWVQVHPTGLVKPDDPDAKVKFLAAEALRGVGGLVLDANGQRFCNELGRRDYVTGEMWKNKPPFRLCLNRAAADEIIWHAKHYTGRGVMKFYPSGEDLAKDMGVPLQTLIDTHQKHYEAAKKQETNQGGVVACVATEPFYVAIITPVIHYCMGGLECTVDAECIDKSGKVIPGLYVAGEAAGGIHGNNRLGGNSLLDCVVFGRDPQRLMSILDMDQNGRISYTEFLAAVLSTSETLPESMVQEAFDVFDVDGDGQISLSELRVMLSGQGKGCHDDTLVLPNGQTVDDVMEEIAGGKQSISFQDFVAYIGEVSTRRRTSRDMTLNSEGPAGQKIVDSMCQELEGFQVASDEEAPAEDIDYSRKKEDTERDVAQQSTTDLEAPPSEEEGSDDKALWRAFGPQSKELWTKNRPSSGGTLTMLPREVFNGTFPAVHDFLLKVFAGTLDADDPVFQDRRRALDCLLHFPEQPITTEKSDLLAANISSLSQHFMAGMVLARLLADAEDSTKGGSLHQRLQQAIEAMKVDVVPTPRNARHEEMYSPYSASPDWMPSVPSPPPSVPLSARKEASPLPSRQLRSRPPMPPRPWGAQAPPRDELREERLANLRRKTRPQQKGRLRHRQAAALSPKASRADSPAKYPFQWQVEKDLC
eukprot:g31526.t1